MEDGKEYTSEQIKELKLLFINHAKSYLLQLEHKDFIIDDDNSKVINNLFLYFIRSKNCKLELNKGLWIEGSLGIGKSLTMRIFSDFCRIVSKITNFTFVSKNASQITDIYKENGNLDAFTWNKNGFYKKPIPLHIDELGREERPVDYYGTKLNVCQRILEDRYEIWQRFGVPTFITTNLQKDEVISFYESHIQDRVRHMCNVITWKSKNRRL